MEQVSFDDMMKTFFVEEPHWLVTDVKYFTKADGEEPVLCLSTEGMNGFIDWALRKGIVGRPERIPAFKAWIAEISNPGLPEPPWIDASGFGR